MKQVRFSVLFVSMLCVLIGYFEPANAASVNKSITKNFYSDGNAYAILNTTTGACPFYPNPISPNQPIIGVSDASDPISSASIIYIGGGDASTVEGNQQFPMTVEGNTQFPIDNVQAFFASSITLTATTFSFPTLSAGNYVLTVTTKSGNTYTTKITVSTN
jgi:hypothetical protein